MKLDELFRKKKKKKRGVVELIKSTIDECLGR